ncbi:MAG: hypothetical protein ACU0AX_02595 [Roseovarius sp.]|uniref:hypothetical protein n=1 Tax=Roseovarius sp. TaxID=1486281 RepID=UPI004057DB11
MTTTFAKLIDRADQEARLLDEADLLDAAGEITPEASAANDATWRAFEEAIAARASGPRAAAEKARAVRWALVKRDNPEEAAAALDALIADLDAMAN